MGSPRGKDLEEAMNDKETRAKIELSEQGQARGMVDEEQRSCTDFPCCCLFLLFVIAMIGISGFAFTSGNPQTLLTLFDSDGNRCGLPNQKATDANEIRDFTEYKFKYFTNIQDLLTTNQVVSDEPSYVYSVCVKACPTKTNQTECLTNSDVTRCPNGLVNPLQYNTVELMGYCVPPWSELTNIGTDALAKLDQMAGGSFSRYMYDIYEAWGVLLGMAFASLLITILYLFLLQWLMAPLLYISMLLFFICGVGFTAFSFIKYSEFPEGSEDKNTALALGIVAGVITLLYTVCICCMYSSISIGIAVLKVTSRFIRDNKCLTAGPLFTYLFLIPVMVWWLASCVYLYSIGEAYYVKSDMFPRMQIEQTYQIAFWCFFFGIIWIILFMSAVQQFTTITAGVTWYFTGQGSDAKDESNYSLMDGFRWAFRYHPGSLAFGSFLIFVVTLIKIIFEYFAKKAEALEQGDQTGAVKCLLCCMRCCIWCVDCCVRFITENAYIQVAINSTWFCESAKNSFYMMIRNPGTYAATSTIGFVMTLIGKGLITALVAWLTWLITGYALPNVEQPIVPGVVGGIMGFFTASLFLQLFDFSSLTILTCYLVNKENGGSLTTPEELQVHIDGWEQDEANYKEKKRQEYVTTLEKNKANDME